MKLLQKKLEYEGELDTGKKRLVSGGKKKEFGSWKILFYILQMFSIQKVNDFPL
jgi:hypothetical protein